MADYGFYNFINSTDLIKLAVHYKVLSYTTTYGVSVFCPFHDDKNHKSARIYPDSNSMFCFFSYKTFRPIDFILHFEGITLHELKKRYAKQYANSPFYIPPKKVIKEQLIVTWAKVAHSNEFKAFKEGKPVQPLFRFLDTLFLTQ